MDEGSYAMMGRINFGRRPSDDDGAELNRALLNTIGDLGSRLATVTAERDRLRWAAEIACECVNAEGDGCCGLCLARLRAILGDPA